MKRFLLFTLSFFSIIQLNAQAFPDATGFLDVTANDCNGTFDFLIEIPVSGLPTDLGPEIGIWSVDLSFDYEFAFSGQINIVAPDGTSQILAAAGFGDFPSFDGLASGEFFDPAIRLCSNGLTHNSTDNNDATFTDRENGVLPQFSYDILNMQGIDPNGTWLVTGCVDPTISGSVQHLSTFLVFTDVNCPYAEDGFTTITPLSSCSANDGSITYELVTNCNPGVYNRQINDGPIETIAINPGTINLQTIDNLPAGDLKIGFGFDGVICREQTFTIPVQGNPPAEGYINCQNDVDLAIGTDCQTTFRLDAPDFGDPCGNEVVADYLITTPDGSSFGPTVWNPNTDPLPELFLDQIGTYTIEWSVLDLSGNVLELCIFSINTSKDDKTNFSSSLCATGGEEVFYCDLFLGFPPSEHPINVTGLDNLNNDYGLATVFIDAAFPNGPVIGDVTLIDPDGNNYILFSLGAFPFFDGSNGDILSVDLKACDVYPNVNDNVPYTPGGLYTPFSDLSTANTSGIDPNGTWILQTCSNDEFASWDILCWGISFEKNQPVLANCPADQTVDLGGASSVSWSVVAPNASDNCALTSATVTYTPPGGGTSNTPFQDGETITDMANASGMASYEWEIEDNDGNTESCTTKITITGQGDPCANDTEDPVLTNCPPNASYMLQNGQADWDVQDPSFSDNCGVTFNELEITYPNGSMEFYDIYPGQSFPYSTTLVGDVFFIYTVEDDAGNSASCTAIITITDGGDPCDNDMVDPVLTDCPPNATYQLENGEVEWEVVDPSFSDNCGVVFSQLEIMYPSGSIETWDIYPGQSFPYFASEAGDAIFTYTVEDAAGNSASCTAIITILGEGGCTDTEAPVLIDCPIDFTLALDLDNTKSWSMRTPDASDDCGIASSMMKVSYPDGTEDEFSFNPGNNVTINYENDESADLILEWTVTDMENNSTSCSTVVFMNDGSFSRFNQAISNSDDFVEGARCNMGGTRFPIEVHGQEDLSDDNSLINVRFDGNLRDGFNGDIILISPWGDEQVLASGNDGSFPGFVGFENNPDVGINVNFRECLEATSAEANSLSYDEGLFDVRPADDLANLNASGEDPNGIWFIEICDYTNGDDIVMFAAHLNFGAICPSVHEYEVTDADNCETNGTITVDKTFAGSCTGILDRYYSIDGGNNWVLESEDDPRAVFTDLAPGNYNVWVGFENNGNYECQTSTAVEVGGMLDTQDPVLAGCPSNATYELVGADVTFPVQDPTFSDNCDVTSNELEISYADGSMETKAINSGQSSNYTVSIPGQITFRYTVEDGAGNSDQCSATITISENDPCENDTENPLLTDCPSDAAYMLENGEVSFEVQDPSFSDNCEVSFAELEVTYADGSSETFEISPGSSFPYTVNVTGEITFTYTVQDAAGNTAQCSATVTITEGDPCDNDTIAPEVECPADLEVEMVDGVAEWDFTDPTVTDNCDDNPIGTLTIEYPDGSSESFDLDPGATFSYNTNSEGTATFTVTVSDESGNVSECVTIITIVDVVSTGDIPSVEAFTIYPSLTEDFVSLSVVYNEATASTLRIFDGQGKLVKSQVFTKTSKINETLDITAFKAGIYYIQLLVDGQYMTQRITKM